MSTEQRRPSLARVADWVEGRLDGDVAAEVEAAVAADPELQDLVAWLEDFSATTQALPLETPPPLVQQRLRQYFDRWSTARAVLDRPVPVSTADLVFDSRVDRPLTGVRGAFDETAFHLAYSCALADVVVDARPRPDGLLDLSGQVLPTHDGGATVFEASVQGSGPALRSVDGDDLGRFALSGVTAEYAELRVGNGEIELVAALNLRPIGP